MCSGGGNVASRQALPSIHIITFPPSLFVWMCLRLRYVASVTVWRVWRHNLCFEMLQKVWPLKTLGARCLNPARYYGVFDLKITQTILMSENCVCCVVLYVALPHAASICCRRVQIDLKRVSLHAQKQSNRTTLPPATSKHRGADTTQHILTIHFSGAREPKLTCDLRA